MASYENCPENVELISIATLESVFEMEQVVIRLDANGIPWRVVENDSMLFKDLAANLGHSTLYVAKGREQDALDLLLAHRKQQLEGRECPSCKLWLGPSVDICPACGVSQGVVRVLEGVEKGEEVPDGEDAGADEENTGYEGVDGGDFEEEEEEEIEMLLESLEKLQDSIEMIQTSMGRLVSRLEDLDERLQRLEKAAPTEKGQE